MTTDTEQKKELDDAFDWFTDQMYSQIMANPGDQQNWEGESRKHLWSRLQYEVNRLALTMNGRPWNEVVSNAAYVANFAMMIADLHRENP